METNDFEKLDQLIKTKSFDQLSEQEKQWVLKLLPDIQVYTKVRHMITEVHTDATPKLARSTKIDLMHQFKTKHSSTSFGWLYYKLPAHASFLCAIGLALLFWLLTPTKEIVVEKPVTVHLPGRVDTLIVRSAPDTIYVHKVKRVEVPVYITQHEKMISEPNIQGSSMAEQSELDDFLVSSSLP